VAEIASVLRKTGATSQASEPKNLVYDDSVVLFIKHTNHLEVAQVCKDYWKDKLGKNLTITESAAPSRFVGEYELIPPHNGFVRLIGTVEWPAPQFEGLSQHLSQSLNTMVFETQDVDFSGGYHFGVYDQGVRKFHAQMDVKVTGDNENEVVTTEGNDWAIANGYKPGPEGFKKFDLSEADKMTQRLGMKFWDEEEGKDLKGLVLKE
jgi:hypothetical protein